MSTKSEQDLANKFKLLLRDRVGCTGGTGYTRSTGDGDNKLPGVCPRLVFNRSSGTSIGEVGPHLWTSMAGHSLSVGGSCHCPQDLHCHPLAATGRRLSAGVCLVLLPDMLGTCSI